jgi:hypothetical protein
VLGEAETQCAMRIATVAFRDLPGNGINLHSMPSQHPSSLPV